MGFKATLAEQAQQDLRAPPTICFFFCIDTVDTVFALLLDSDGSSFPPLDMGLVKSYLVERAEQNRTEKGVYIQKLNQKGRDMITIHYKSDTQNK